MEGRKKILIAEDEKPLSRALSLKLEKVGINSVVAADGDEVKKQVQMGGYDLILMDLMMPRHDGFAVIESMKAQGDTTPVVILSNLSQDTDRTRAALAGAASYLVKSDVTLAGIVEFIQKTLG